MITQSQINNGLLCEPIACDLCKAPGDGNVFGLLGYWRKCAQKAGRTSDEIKSVLDEAMCNDYSHCIVTLVRHSV
jgi:hypothetical protein